VWVVIDGYKFELGPTQYSGQYQQNPVNLKGGILVRDWWQPYEIPMEGERKGVMRRARLRHALPLPVHDCPPF
jgi:hypothetical protein